eukprot:GDKI01021678.1.p2 GENE.GDKI01021678.1~~GDKI01021678.1.p2  ORF type:complete len:146 (+),score=46.08 GDKI01021678.1:36-473(+)
MFTARRCGQHSLCLFNRRHVGSFAAVFEPPTPPPKYLGHVMSFDKTKGFGYIELAESGSPVFVHHSDIARPSDFLDMLHREDEPVIVGVGRKKKKNPQAKLNWKDDEQKSRYWLRPGDRVRMEVHWDEAADKQRAVLVEVLQEEQ